MVCVFITDNCKSYMLHFISSSNEDALPLLSCIWFTVLFVWFLFHISTHFHSLTSISVFLLSPREYWMIYRGPGFLAAVWFGFPPSPFCGQQVVSLSQSFCVSLNDGRRGGCGRGAKSYDGEKAWPSINQSILSVSPLSPLALWIASLEPLHPLHTHTFTFLQGSDKWQLFLYNKYFFQIPT